MLLVLLNNALFAVLDAFRALFTLSAHKIMVRIAFTLLVIVKHKEVFCITLGAFSEVVAIHASNNFLIARVASVSVEDSVHLALAFSINWSLVETFLCLALEACVGLLALVAAGYLALNARVVEFGVIELAGAGVVGVWLLVPEFFCVALFTFVAGFR